MTLEMPERQILQLRMRLRLLTPTMWRWEGDFIRIPAGERATVVVWKEIIESRDGRLFTKGRGCAFLFDTIKHPKFNAFPQELFDINIHPVPHNYEVI